MADEPVFEGAEVVFFDIDNTLYDFEGSVQATLRHVQARFPDLLGGYAIDALERAYWAANGSIPKEERLALIERNPDEYRRANWRAFLEREALDVPEGRREGLAAALGDTFTEYRFGRLREAQYEECDDTVRAFLKRYTVGVISNGPGKLQRSKLEALGYGSLFEPDLVFISGEFGEHKPAPSIFEAAARAAGADPDACVMIGDDRENDMPAKRVGMRTLLFDGKCIGPDCARDPFPPDASATHYRHVRRSFGHP